MPSRPTCSPTGFGAGAGLYRFLAIEHRLLELDLAARTGRSELREAASDQDFIAESAVTFIWTGGRLPDDLSLRGARLPLSSARRRACLPEPLPGRRADRLRDVRHRGVSMTTN